MNCISDPDDPYKLTDDTRSLGIVVCRGTAVVLICPVDGMEAIANPFIAQEPWRWSVDSNRRISIAYYPGCYVWVKDSCRPVLFKLLKVDSTNHQLKCTVNACDRSCIILWFWEMECNWLRHCLMNLKDTFPIFCYLCFLMLSFLETGFHKVMSVYRYIWKIIDHFV